MATSKQQLLKEMKMELIEWLRVDKDLILNYADSKSVITDSEYTRLKEESVPDTRNAALIDLVRGKGEEKCAQFFNLLKHPKIQETYPELSKWMSSLPASGSQGGSSESMAASKYMIGDKHFIDKHRKQLIDRVTTVDPILDHLLEKDVIKHEAYSIIRSKPTSYEKMRELMEQGNIRDTQGKDILYEVLMKENHFLMKSLKEGS